MCNGAPFAAETIPPHAGFEPGPEVINHFSCSIQLRMKFQMLISIKSQEIQHFFVANSNNDLTLLFSERPKLYAMSAIGLKTY